MIRDARVNCHSNSPRKHLKMTLFASAALRSSAATLALAVGLISAASPAQATRVMGGDCQTYATPNAPILPEHFAPSAGGVDMRSGRFLYSHTDLSIGGDDGIKLERTFSPVWHNSTPYFRAFGSLTHNWDIWINEDRIQTCISNGPAQDDYRVEVFADGVTKSFRAMFSPPSDGFERESAGGYARLEFTYTLDPNGYHVPDKYTMYADDGTKIAFNSPAGGIGARTARAASITEPDGTNYAFSYDTNLRTVVSNRGYAIVFDYTTVPYGTGNLSVVSKACILNLAVTPLPAMNTGAMCPTGVRTATYTYTNSEISSFTDQGGVAAQLGAGASALYRPGEATPYLTNTMSTGYGTRPVSSQTFADGRTFSYSWNHTSNLADPQIMGGTVTDNAGKTISVVYQDYRQNSSDPTYLATPGPVEITDQLGRKKTYDYCLTGPYCNPQNLLSAKDPELNTRAYAYDGHDNVAQITYAAKPGSGLANIVEGKAYTCTADACASKPTSVTDARLNTTDYTYDPVHGGLLIDMAPAPSTGAARPLKLLTWVQKYAYVKSGASLVQAATPVWLVGTETQCQTAAGSSVATCDASAPKRVTTYQYVTGAATNALLPRGKLVTADGLGRRTCWVYDNFGKRVAETTPRAGLSTCP